MRVEKGKAIDKAVWVPDATLPPTKAMRERS
jgi:hypothetical protein